MQEIPKALLNSVPPRDGFRANLIYFVSDLHVNGDLVRKQCPQILWQFFLTLSQPAILFSFDRSDCEIMAQDLLRALERAEEKWKHSSPEWNQKVRDWEMWKGRAKERERLAERAKKQKKDPDEPDAASAHDGSWEQSFNPGDPLPQFSFAGVHTSYSKSELDDDIAGLAWLSIQPWAIACLRRGVAVHHAGMNKRYRSLVER
jgi:superfamily II RNA helicase